MPSPFHDLLFCRTTGAITSCAIHSICDYLSIDCRDIYQQSSQVTGIYVIWPDPSPASHPIHVLCDFDDDGQWVILQQRVNGDVNFQQDWASCRDGFGRMNYDSDFWWVIAFNICQIIYSIDLNVIDTYFTILSVWWHLYLPVQVYITNKCIPK